jgi:hypothetical protein
VLPADTPAKRRVDHLLPARGSPAVAYFAAVIGLLGLAQILPPPAYLAVDAAAFLAAGSWCALNFWRCRPAHCLLTGSGWPGGRRARHRRPHWPAPTRPQRSLPGPILRQVLDRLGQPDPAALAAVDAVQHLLQARPFRQPPQLCGQVLLQRLPAPLSPPLQESGGLFLVGEQAVVGVVEVVPGAVTRPVSCQPRSANTTAPLAAYPPELSGFTITNHVKLLQSRLLPH